MLCSQPCRHCSSHRNALPTVLQHNNDVLLIECIATNQFSITVLPLTASLVPDGTVIQQYIYIYIYLSKCSDKRSRAPGTGRAPFCALSANRTSKLDLYCQVGLQVGLVLPSWAPNWTCTANLGSNLASKWLSRALQTFNFARQYGTLATFLQIGLYALQVLLDYFLAAVDTFLGAFWAQLGVS